MERVVHGMKLVMEPGGTASTAALPGLTMAGKTGTAQVRVRSGDILNNAWFIGFAPVEKPRIAICVFVEHAGHGGDVAAPIAKQVLAKYFNIATEGAEGTGAGD
jgi:cell division protein FtsI/penicillin-binding protein 2